MSTTSVATTPTASIVRRLLDDIGALAPAVTARAAELEAGRRIPPDLVETLKSIDVFRMFVPRSHGGLELDLPSALDVIAALSRIDGSVGWTAMIGNAGDLITPLLPREIYKRIYQHGPNVIIAGSVPPMGTAERTDGGWRVNGRWPFASGCQHADWMFGMCTMTEDGKPLAGRGTPRLVRGVFLPARDWQIEDTWYVAGLKGTGSHHITVRDTVVPAANFFDFPNGVSCMPGPLYQSTQHFLPLFHGAVAVGTAEGALDELVALANTGRQQQRAAVPMRESETFQFELGRIAADVRAARAVLSAQVRSHWHHALDGTLKGEPLFMQGTQTAIWLVTTCVRVADACFTLGGGSAVYDSSPLQRRLRDLHVAAQHGAAQQLHYVSAGKLLLGGSGRPDEYRRRSSFAAGPGAFDGDVAC